MDEKTEIQIQAGGHAAAASGAVRGAAQGVVRRAGAPSMGQGDDLGYDFSSVHPLYEDNHLLVVAKPAGLPIQSGTNHATSLLDITKSWLKQKYDKPGNVFLGLVHRLDRSVGGVVVFAKTSKGASRLSEQFRDRTVEKTYHALAVVSENAGDWEDDIDGKKGRLSFQVERRFAKTALVRIALETGRKHQIRIQFSKRGAPLLGDAKYGSTLPFYPGAIALEATSLEFEHPIRKGERIRVDLPAELSLIERYRAEYYPTAH